MADRTRLDSPGSVATLLRDREQTSQFISFGPWDSIEEIEQWRASETFSAGVAKLGELLDSFVPHTMDVAIAIS